MKMANALKSLSSTTPGVRAVYGYDQRVEAFGSKGMASV